MRRSKLETYEAILSVLAKRPLKVDSIAYRIGMDCTVLHQYLEALQRYGLVQEKISGKKRLYAITDRGMAVFRTLSFQRYLDKIAKSIRTSAVKTTPTPVITRGEDENLKGEV